MMYNSVVLISNFFYYFKTKGGVVRFVKAITNIKDGF